MQQIIINGVNLNDIEAQINSVRQEATALISQNIELAQSLTKQLVVHNNKVEMREMAKNAYEALEKASFIGRVTGVHCSLPYNSGYSGYYDKDTLSAMLEDSDNEVLKELFAQSAELKALLNLACDMEYDSKHWDSSVC